MLEAELTTIKEDLLKNGYPNYLIQQEIRKQQQQLLPNNTNTQINASTTRENTDLTRTKYLSTPYIKGTSERVQRMFNGYGIKLSNKPCSQLK